MADSINLLKAAWLNLVFLNYEVEKGLLERYLPDGLELDTYNDRHYMSVVGLMHLHTEVAGISDPIHPEFEQINLRFYVKRTQPSGGIKRGVVFVREIVPALLPAVAARTLYNERYVTAPMRHAFAMPSDGADAMGSFDYEWQSGAGDDATWHRLHAATTGTLHNVQMGSKEEFLTQRSWGFSGSPGMTTLQYRVEHPTWRIWASSHAKLECDIKEVFGRELVPYLSGAPALSFVAEGSPVIVHLPHGLDEDEPSDDAGSQSHPVSGTSPSPVP